MSEYVIRVCKVVTACADKWKDKGDSNWYTNMYLDYACDYTTPNCFIEEEVCTIESLSDIDEDSIKYVVNAMLNLLSNIGKLQPELTYEQLGELCMRILLGAC